LLETLAPAGDGVAVEAEIRETVSVVGPRQRAPHAATLLLPVPPQHEPAQLAELGFHRRIKLGAVLRPPEVVLGSLGHGNRLQALRWVVVVGQPASKKSEA
jgi:hypothetical protein